MAREDCSQLFVRHKLLDTVFATVLARALTSGSRSGGASGSRSGSRSLGWSRSNSGTRDGEGNGSDLVSVVRYNRRVVHADWLLPRSGLYGVQEWISCGRRRRCLHASRETSVLVAVAVAGGYALRSSLRRVMGAIERSTHSMVTLSWPRTVLAVWTARDAWAAVARDACFVVGWAGVMSLRLWRLEAARGRVLHTVSLAAATAVRLSSSIIVSEIIQSARSGRVGGAVCCGAVCCGASVSDSASASAIDMTATIIWCHLVFLELGYVVGESGQLGLRSLD
jgi:hypothetical protein